MSNLWNPDSNTRSSLASGERKIRLGYLKPSLRACECPYCKRDMYYYEDKHKYLTLGGSDHRCKSMPPKDSELKQIDC